MNVINCPSCGGDIRLPEPEGGPSLTLTCPQCASRLAVSVFLDGAETLFQPQLLGAEVEALPPSSDPGATVALGSSTALLDSDAKEPSASVPVVLQAALIWAGAEPGRERFTLAAERTTVGREDSDIVIGDAAMSSRHFEVEIRGREYFLRDLESSNGTFLNGDRIRAAELASGDTIRAGLSSFTFRVFEAIALDVTE